MRIKIFVHPESRESFWRAQCLKAIAAEILHKRYTADYLNADSIIDIDFSKVFTPGEKKVLIYIGYSPKDSRHDLMYLAKQGIHALLINYGGPNFSGSCSRVLLNYRDAMEKCIGYLVANKHDRIALFGINPHSSTDVLKSECFSDFLHSRDNDPSRDIYYNYGSINDCFVRFAENRTAYNAVICANDIVAMSLLRRLGEIGVRVPEDVYIVSCSYSTLLSQRSNPTITTIDADSSETGRQVIFAYTSLVKNPADIALTVRVAAKLIVRGSTNFDPDPEDSDLSIYKAPAAQVDFYAEPDTQNFMRTESLLLSSDELDLDILDGILNGETYPNIAERLYTSEHTIAYRIKRMCKIAGCRNRSELVALLSPYMKQS